MTATTTLLGLSGSLRTTSMNTALLRAARELAPDGVEVVLHPLDDLPFYNGDVEQEGLPEPVRRLREAVAAADGLLLASPEYNHSTTAVLKNAIDWLSRGPDSPLDRLPAALLSAAGGSGGSGAQAHLRDILVHNRVELPPVAVQIPRAWQHLTEGELSGAEQRAEVAALVRALVEVAGSRPGVADAA